MPPHCSRLGKLQEVRYTLEFVVKVIAAIAALVPFLGGIVSLKPTMDPGMRELSENHWFMSSMCFGISYAATTDIWATIVGYIIAANLFSLTRFSDDGVETFSFGYGALKGMDVAEASARLTKVVPTMKVEVVDTLKDNKVPNRMQLVCDKQNKVVGYKCG